MRTFLLLVLGFTFSSLSAQNTLAEIINSSRDFETIVAQGEDYFKDKHPDIPFYELTIGEHRDGEFVKFMRWRKFWSERLNDDGTLGDISAYGKRRLQGSSAGARQQNPYANEVWTNISYSDYIVSQIGLGRTTSIGFHPTDSNTFYVGAAIGGVWKTTNGGNSYTPVGDDLPFLAVSSIIVNRNNPNTLYIAVSDHVWYGPQGIGVYKSTNGGNTWSATSLAFDFADNVRIYWMEADPNNASRMLVATSNGLYRTTNGFNSVSKINSVNAFHVRYQPGNSNNVILSSRNGQIYRSTNGGASFDLITDLGDGETNLDLSPLDDQLVYARVGEELHKSTDAGLTFTEVSSSLLGATVFKISPNNVNVLISGNFDTYRSNNGGATFSALTHWQNDGDLPNIHVDQRNMFINPLENDAIYFCNDGGVYRYTVSSSTFENLSDGLMITQFYDIAVAQTDDNIIGGGSQDNGNVFRASDGSWSQYATTGDGMNQEIDFTNAGIRYWSYQYGSVHRYQNGSNTNVAPSGQSGEGAWETPFKLDPSNANRFIIAYDRVYASNNRGDNWVEISGQLAGGSNLDELAIAPTNGQRIYVTEGSDLFVRDENDGSWTAKDLPNGSVSDIEVDFLDMNTIYVSTPGFSNGNKVFKSTDAGDTWTNISSNLPNVSTGALELVQGTVGGVLVGTDAGVFYKDDQAQVWLQYGDLPNTRVEDIEIQYAAQLIRIGTHGRGILEAAFSIQACTAASPDEDNDGLCDFIDQCPGFNNNLVGQGCDDGDPFSQGESYTSECACGDGAAFVDYCSGDGDGATVDWISRVELNTIDNSSNKSEYSDFRAVSTRLDHGSSHQLEVTLNHAFDLDRVYAWVDFDRNGTFDEDERIVLSTPVSRRASGTVNVPLDAVQGAVTMRVRNTYFGLDEPCGSSAGEVEDYTVSLVCVGGSISSQCGALPLAFKSFSALSAGVGRAQLNWETEAEENVSHFIVERSLDGARFEDIGRVEANNVVSLNAYRLLDESVNSTRAFYRVRAVDFDGATTLTPIRNVSWTREDKESIQIFPNPVADVLYASFIDWNNGIVDWEILDVDGRLLRTGSATIDGFSVNVAQLPKGSYLLRVSDGTREEVLSFLR